MIRSTTLLLVLAISAGATGTAFSQKRFPLPGAAEAPATPDRSSMSSAERNEAYLKDYDSRSHCTPPKKSKSILSFLDDTSALQSIYEGCLRDEKRSRWARETSEEIFSHLSPEAQERGIERDRINADWAMERERIRRDEAEHRARFR